MAVEIDKPVRRGVLLRMSKTEEPRWFQAQYERLPYYCFACGLIGHSEMDCPTPVARNEHGKLPYDVQLRAPEERRKRLQSFAGAAAESFGSGSSSAFRSQKQHSRPNDSRSTKGDDGSHHSASFVDESEDPEVLSPLKQQVRDGEPVVGKVGSGASRQLNMQVKEDLRPHPRKRKSKVAASATQTPNLNLPSGGSSTLVPVGLVNSRVNQLDNNADSGGSSMIETLKKQKRGNSQNARSTAAATGSPRRAQ